MFYRVIIVKEAINSKSIIVRAKSKDEVEKMIPRVKDMLFPEEDAMQLRSVITTREVEAYSPGIMVVEYQVTIYKPELYEDETNFEIEDIMADASSWYEETIEAESKEEAKARVMAKGCPYPNVGFEECSIYINEITVSKLIEEMEKSIFQRIENEYIRVVINDMTVREFSDIQRNPDKKNRFRYDALKFTRTAFAVCSVLGRRKIDLAKMSAQEYIDFITTVSQIEDSVTFEEAFKSIEEKYKKENKD